MSTGPTTTSPRSPLVPVVAGVLGLAGLAGAAFMGWIAFLLLHGLAGREVGLRPSDWPGYLMAVGSAALLLAGAPLVMGIGWRDRRWLLAAGIVVAVVLAVGVLIGLTAG